ncbi:MAG: hypothetical protein IAI50_08485 [Candidatus Eremiobacteraeota bacterium]|nr:hypothetical protein [Candidatus Eremiobacteraeota bacterium]
MGDIDPIFTVEETQLELTKKRGISPWLIIGAIVVVIAFVLGLRRADAKKKRSQEAVPTAELPA